MPQTDSPAARPLTLFTRRNLVLLAIALLTIVGGYAILLGGDESSSLAAVVLVVGYCLLFPLALLV